MERRAGQERTQRIERKRIEVVGSVSLQVFGQGNHKIWTVAATVTWNLATSAKPPERGSYAANQPQGLSQPQWLTPASALKHVQASKVSSKRQELERKARPRASRRRDSIISRIELVNSPAHDVLDQHHHGSTRGGTLPPQGRPGLRNQGRHDHYRCWSFRLDHSKHPHQAELWINGRLHQVRRHYCRLRYADLLDWCA